MDSFDVHRDLFNPQPRPAKLYSSSCLAQPENQFHGSGLVDDEIIRLLAFDLVVQRGMKDSEEGRTITNEEMHRRIKTRQNLAGLTSERRSMVTLPPA